MPCLYTNVPFSSVSTEQQDAELHDLSFTCGAHVGVLDEWWHKGIDERADYAQLELIQAHNKCN